MNQRLRHLIADLAEQQSIGTSLCEGSRGKCFAGDFPDIEKMRVLDLGGTVRYWETSLVRPKAVVVVNLLPEQEVECAGPDKIDLRGRIPGGII